MTERSPIRAGATSRSYPVRDDERAVAHEERWSICSGVRHLTARGLAACGERGAEDLAEGHAQPGCVSHELASAPIAGSPCATSRPRSAGRTRNQSDRRAPDASDQDPDHRRRPTRFRARSRSRPMPATAGAGRSAAAQSHRLRRDDRRRLAQEEHRRRPGCPRRPHRPRSRVMSVRRTICLPAPSDLHGEPPLGPLLLLELAAALNAASACSRLGGRARAHNKDRDAAWVRRSSTPASRADGARHE
jgi:hypothetical protein